MPTKKELEKLTKEMLFAKYDGLCAFCGHPLGEKWHIWHIESNKTIVTAKEVILPNDTYENKEPACISCNTTRNNNSHGDRKLDVEGFRSALYWEFEFLRNGMTYATIYKKMVKYGLIEETGREIGFYFEKIKQQK